MSDLGDFIRARLDEDELAARAVEDRSAPWSGQWKADENLALRTYNGWVLAVADYHGGEFQPGVLEYIARHDPARALREVEADRKLIAVYEDVAEFSDPWIGLDLAVRIRAERFRDNPDYRQEWKP